MTYVHMVHGKKSKLVEDPRVKAFIKVKGGLLVNKLIIPHLYIQIEMIPKKRKSLK